MERCFFEFGPISKILAYLSHIDEYNLSATCSFLYSLIYTYRHWCINRYNCLSNKLNSYPRHFSYINYLILSKSSRIQIEYPDEESCLLSTSSCGYLKYSSVFGWGVYAKKTIPKHSIIHYYCGEMISTREMRNRYEDYDQQVLIIRYLMTPFRN